MKEEKIIIEEVSPRDYDKEDYKIKIIIVGDSGVGKTNLITRFASDKFDKNSKATIGVEFIYKTIKINNEIFKIEIWDTAGQERYNTIQNHLYKNINGILLTFDLTNTYSFEQLSKWYEQIQNQSQKNCIIVLIGNKNDLKEQIQVKEEDIQKYCNEHNEMPYFSCSAQSSENVEEAFTKVAEVAFERNSKSEEVNLPEIKPVQVVKEPEKKKCCF